MREEVNSLEHILDLGTLELMTQRLPSLVGSPLSINALSEDLQVSHKTVSNWLDILERLYMIVRLLPFGPKPLRAVRKEKKHYHYDWTVVKDPGKRFENMVAMHLLKWVNYRGDTEGTDAKLKFFRDIDGRETDFIVEEDGVPHILIKAKPGDDEVSKGLTYLKVRFPSAEAWQISLKRKEGLRFETGDSGRSRYHPALETRVIHTRKPRSSKPMMSESTAVDMEETSSPEQPRPRGLVWSHPGSRRRACVRAQGREKLRANRLQSFSYTAIST